jgi:hypothetical protein
LKIATAVILPNPALLAPTAVSVSECPFARWITKIRKSVSAPEAPRARVRAPLMFGLILPSSRPKRQQYRPIIEIREAAIVGSIRPSTLKMPNPYPSLS